MESYDHEKKIRCKINPNHLRIYLTNPMEYLQRPIDLATRRKRLLSKQKHTKRIRRGTCSMKCLAEQDALMCVC